VPFTLNFGETDYVTLTRSTFEARFSVVPSEHADNAVAFNEYFSKRMANAVNQLRQAVDVSAVTAINGGRTVFSAASWPAAFNVTPDQFEMLVPAASTPTAIQEQGALLLSSVSTAFADNGLENPAYIVGNAGMNTFLQYRNRYGQSNEKNWGQMLEGMEAFGSNNIARPAGQYLNFFALQAGSYGLHTWTSLDARQKRQSGNIRVFTQYLPELGQDVEITIQSNFADLDGVLAGASGRTYAETVAISFDVVHTVAYNSTPTTKANPIMKFSLLDA
jgi:hypothetical protein